MNRTIAKTVCAVCIPLVVGWFGFHKFLTEPNNATVPKTKFPGGKQGALDQSNALLVALSANNWDYLRVPRELLTLADEPAPRDTRVRQAYSFRFNRQPAYEDLAFFSPTYIQRRLTIVPGSEGTLAETGYYILGFKNGVVTTCTANEVRYLANPQDEGWLLVFPGMAVYGQASPTPQ